MSNDYPSLKEWYYIIRYGDWNIGVHPDYWFTWPRVMWYDGWWAGITWFKINLSVHY